MDLWRHTFSELTGGIAPVGDSPAMEMPVEFSHVVPLEADPRYGTAPIKEGAGLQDQALVRLDGGERTPIGVYWGDTIIVWGDGKRGLGTELFLRCIKHRNGLPITKKMTQRGGRLIKRAHRISIERALKGGEDVRPEVLAEYQIVGASR
jgi:hypothetical protein